MATKDLVKAKQNLIAWSPSFEKVYFYHIDYPDLLPDDVIDIDRAKWDAKHNQITHEAQRRRWNDTTGEFEVFEDQAEMDRVTKLKKQQEIRDEYEQSRYDSVVYGGNEYRAGEQGYTQIQMCIDVSAALKEKDVTVFTVDEQEVLLDAAEASILQTEIAKSWRNARKLRADRMKTEGALNVTSIQRGREKNG